MHLTGNEITFLLELIQDKFGPGYAPEKATGVNGLQVKLSMMAQVKNRLGAKSQGDLLVNPRTWNKEQGK